MADTNYTPFPQVQPTADGAPPLSIPADAEDFGAGVGRGLRRTGAVLQRAQEAEFGLSVQMAAQQQETQAVDASSEYSRRVSAAQLEYRKLNGQQAVDKLPEYQKQLAALRGEIGKTLKGPIAQRAYKVRTSAYETSALESLGTHAANEGDRAKVASLQGANGAARDRAVQKVLAGQNAGIDYAETVNTSLEEAHFLGLEKDGADALVQQNTNAVTVQVINALVAAGRVEEAKTLLQGSQQINAPGTEIPLLSGEAVAPLTATVQNGLVKSGADFVKTLNPVQRSLVLAKSIEGQSGTPADYLDPGDKVGLYRQSLSDIQNMENEALRQRNLILAEENERKASDLEIMVNRGQGTVDMVERAFDNNVISGAKRVELIKQIEDVGSAGNDALVLATLSGAAVLDHKNPDDVKMANGYFNRNIAPELAKLRVPYANADQNRAKQIVTDYVARTGITPEPVNRMIRGGLRAGSPEFRIAAADMLDMIANKNPYALNGYSAEDIAVGMMMKQAVRDGMSPADATKMADDLEKVHPDVKKMRRERIESREAGQLKSPIDRVTDAALSEASTGRSWAGFVMGYPNMNATITDQARADFRRLFEGVYVLTGDEAQAADAATKVFKRSWGISMSTGAPTLTKNGPEKLYGVKDHGATDAKWMREQLVKEVSAQLRAPSEALPEGMIEPDENTESMFDFETFPMVKNADGTNSHIVTTIRGFEEDGREVQVVLPTMVGGQQLTDEQAIERYQTTGKNFGKFPTVEQAEAWDKRQHEDLDAWLVEKGGGSSGPSLTMFPDVQSGAIYAAPPSRPKQVIDPNRISAAPDIRTGDDGTYGVMIRNKSGEFEPMMGKNGRPMRWRPDWGSSAQAAEDNRKKQRQIDAAKVAREQQRLNMGLPPELQGSINLMR